MWGLPGVCEGALGSWRFLSNGHTLASISAIDEDPLGSLLQSWDLRRRQSSCSGSHRWERCICAPASGFQSLWPLHFRSPGSDLRIRQLSLFVMTVPVVTFGAHFGSWQALALSLSSLQTPSTSPAHCTSPPTCTTGAPSSRWDPTISLSHPESMRDRCGPGS